MKKITKFISAVFLFLLLGITTACNNNYEFEENQSKNDIIFKFETKLNENNITFDKISIDVNEQGAKESYYYYIEEGNPLIVYVFDENSNEYKTILQNKYIKKEHNPEPISVEINKGIVIEKNSDMLHYDSIIKIFNEL